MPALVVEAVCLQMDGGTYEIDDLVLEHSIHAKNGVVHPACLGPSIAR